MKTRTWRGPVVVAAIAVCAGCASTGSGGVRSTSNVLTYEDLVETRETDLRLSILRIRPRWLTPRGQTFVGRVVMLFVDGTPREDWSGLLVTDVQDVTYLSANEAAFRFGTVAGSGGAIAVRTRR